jgi:hypothetical protein
LEASRTLENLIETYSELDGNSLGIGKKIKNYCVVRKQEGAVHPLLHSFLKSPMYKSWG